MSAGLKISRARRSIFRAVGITAAAVFAASTYRKPADAQFLTPAPADIPTFKEDTATSIKESSTSTKDTSTTTTSSPSRDPSGTKVCFARGTRIRTAKGYRPVESLVAGDEVVARFADLSPIREVTNFTLRRTGPNASWAGASRPVRVRAGALGDNSPAQDIMLTASHSVFTGGVLVPVVNLVNGTTIVFETADGHETLDFFHIALARHDVLDAQGAPCESWRDAAVEAPCVPMLSYCGGRDEVHSRLRSAASIVIDRRQPLDIIRDNLEERGLRMAKFGNSADQGENWVLS
ncbi:Hint domain-containing protein [Reyranella sp.]|uniref:Hint domain-containing protein n=1 Tax=Reyranella sp. TaxID=1929291 RepID=UPI003D14A008